MKLKNIGLLALFIVAILPTVYATQTSAQGTIIDDTATGGLIGTISLTKTTVFDTLSTTTGVTHATITAALTTPNTNCDGFYAGSNVNTFTTSGSFLLSCNNGNMIQGIMFGDYTAINDNTLTYDAFIITPTPGPQGLAGSNGLNGTNGMNGTIGPQGLAGSNGLNGTNGLNGSNGSIGPQGPAGRDGTNGTNGSVGTQGPSGDTYYGSAFENCNSNDTIYCSGSRQLKTENHYCKAGFGLDSICLVGQCKEKTTTDSCTFGCSNATCQAPQVWTSSSCSSWCRSGNNIPQTPCNTFSTAIRYVDDLEYCNWQ